MSKNICTLTKWFPYEILEHQDFFDGCKEMEITGLNLITRINLLSNFVKNNKGFRYNQPLVNENEMFLTVSFLQLLLKDYIKFSCMRVYVYFSHEIKL